MPIGRALFDRILETTQQLAASSGRSLRLEDTFMEAEVDFSDIDGSSVIGKQTVIGSDVSEGVIHLSWFDHDGVNLANRALNEETGQVRGEISFNLQRSELVEEKATTADAELYGVLRPVTYANGSGELYVDANCRLHPALDEDTKYDGYRFASRIGMGGLYNLAAEPERMGIEQVFEGTADTRLARHISASLEDLRDKHARP